MVSQVGSPGEDFITIDSNAPSEKADEVPLEKNPPTFQDLLKKGIQILAWTTLVDAVDLFYVSPKTRALLSHMIHAQISFDVVTGTETNAERAAATSQVRRIRACLPQSNASDKLGLYLRFGLRDLPLKRKALNRALPRILPFIRWEDCGCVFLCSHDSLHSVDQTLYSGIESMSGTDTLTFLKQPGSFQNVSKLVLNITQVVTFPDDLKFPQVLHLKLLFRDAAFSDGVLDMISTRFPCLAQLHLVLIPSSLPQFCGPEFAAPQDFRLSLDKSKSVVDQRANIFVSSHLFNLPFSWGGRLFGQVMRLQMDELSKDHHDASIRKMAELVRGLPLLRRLGTLSAKVAQLVDVAREDCQLEEMVVVVEIDEVLDFFKTWIDLEQQKRRAALRRLAVHLLASDGISRPKLEAENAICAGWYTVATNLLHPHGFVCFSLGSRQILETAPIQLAWLNPMHFTLDRVEYQVGSTPCSTPICRPLPYCSQECCERPNGTLVTGSLRPSPTISRAESEVPGSPSSRGAGTPLMSTRPRTGGSTARSNPSRTGTSRPNTSQMEGMLAQQPPVWIGMNLVDAVEALMQWRR